MFLFPPTQYVTNPIDKPSVTHWYSRFFPAKNNTTPDSSLKIAVSSKTRLVNRVIKDQ